MFVGGLELVVSACSTRAGLISLTYALCVSVPCLPHVSRQTGATGLLWGLQGAGLPTQCRAVLIRSLSTVWEGRDQDDVARLLPGAYLVLCGHPPHFFSALTKDHNLFCIVSRHKSGHGCMHVPPTPWPFLHCIESIAVDLMVTSNVTGESVCSVRAIFHAGLLWLQFVPK